MKKTTARNEQRVVLVTQRLGVHETYQEVRQQLSLEWNNFFGNLSSTVFIPVLYGSDVEYFFETCNVAGVLFTGGNDVAINNRSPEKAENATSSIDLGNGWVKESQNLPLALSQLRDRFEEHLLSAAIEHGVAILGVCRGCQFLAARFGATLSTCVGHVATQHTVEFCKNTTPCREIQIWSECNPLLKVNSYHSFGIENTSAMNHLEPILLSGDGNIEALQGTVKKSKIFGIMWHPERSEGALKNADVQLVRNIFSTVGEACKSTIRAIVLCAGQGSRLRPLTNKVPKCMVKYKNHCIIDYILASLRKAGVQDVCLIKGYLASVLERKDTTSIVNNDYSSTNMVATLFCAEEAFQSSDNVIVSYSDIIYSPKIVQTLLSNTADIAVVIDRQWRSLWEARMENPLSDAETLKINDEGFIEEIGKKPKSYDEIHGQYIGLMKFSIAGARRFRQHYHSLDKEAVYDGKSFDNMYMTTLLQSLIDSGVEVTPVFIDGGWTEIDEPTDLNYDLDVSSIVEHISLPFGTKAENLQSLRGNLKHGTIVPGGHITVLEWNDQTSRETFVSSCCNIAESLIVRSSARSEDTQSKSNAGAFCSLDGVAATKGAVASAVDQVIESYGADCDPNDQILVQKSLTPVSVCGVIFTAELQSHRPYFVLSYDTTGSTDSVTSGNGQTQTVYRFRRNNVAKTKHDWEARLYQLAEELERKFCCTALDIEFAVGADDLLYLLQVRPLVLNQRKWHGEKTILERCHRKIFNKLKNHLGPSGSGLLGNSSILGVMSDWNPAEIIGIRPKPLALSLYKELITDRIAMESRKSLGYRDVCHSPLMIVLLGCPYIDLRVSFNSLIPASLHADIAEKLVNYYLEKLRKNPALHDKIEFEIAFTCYYPSIEEDMEELLENGFSSQECERIRFALLDLTNSFICDGLIDRDLAQIKRSEKRLDEVTASNMHVFQKIFFIVQDIKSYGTSSFSNLARFAFVARQFLDSFTRKGLLTVKQSEAFMQSIHSVTRELTEDLSSLNSGQLTKEVFLKKYGHLRPGTYEITSPRYDEAYEAYFSADGVDAKCSAPQEFVLPEQTKVMVNKAIVESGIKASCDTLFDFMRRSTAAREYSKFVFSKALSKVLQLCSYVGEIYGLEKEDLSYLTIDRFTKLYGTLDISDLGSFFKSSIRTGKEQFNLGRDLQLPMLICAPEDTMYFHDHNDRPNFVTTLQVQAPVQNDSQDLKLCDLTGTIVCITNADPGWDWLFSRGIKGLVTCYGGVNSHMAIRAAETNLPAVIGAGTRNFDMWKSARLLSLDCKACRVQIVQK